MKILHTADWHLRDRDIEECEKCLAFLVDTARAESPDLIAIAGDIFDKEDVAVKSQSALLAIKTVSDLADIAPVVIVLGTPSHDGRAPGILRFARGKFDIVVADVPMQIRVIGSNPAWLAPPEMDMVSTPTAIVTLIPTPTKQFFQTRAGIEASDLEIGQAMSGLFAGFGAQARNTYPNVPHILVYHGNISGAKIPSGHVLTGQDIEVSTDQIRMAGGNSTFLGAFYTGPLYPVKVDEQDCGFYIHELAENDFIACMGHIHQGQRLSGDGLKSRRIETPCKRTVRFKDNLCDEGSRLESLFSPPDVAGVHVRYEITMWQDDAPTIHKETIEKTLTDLGALSVDIRLNLIPRVNVRAEQVLAAETLRDEISEMARLREEDIDPDILLKAELLENTPVDELLERIRKAS